MWRYGCQDVCVLRMHGLVSRVERDVHMPYTTVLTDWYRSVGVSLA
jgi:hypothetical protein